MASNKGKILAFLGLIGGAFLMFSSFAGSKTEVPNNDNTGTPSTDDDPTITDPTAESTVLGIGSKYNIQQILFDPKGTNMITLVMQTPGIIKKGWYCEIKLPTDWAGSSYFNGKYRILGVYNSNGVEYVETSHALPKTVQNQKIIDFANTQFSSTGLAKLIIVNWEAPALPHYTINMPALPILRMVAAYNANKALRIGYTFIVVRDTNYLLNTVKYGDLVKLDQTVNAAYNNKTVRVESVRERNPVNSERILEVEMPYHGSNTGGQVLLINSSN